MDNNEQKVNTGNKGVFPGTNTAQQTAPHNSPNPTPNPTPNQAPNQGHNQQQVHAEPQQGAVSSSVESDVEPTPDSDTYMNLQCKNTAGEVSGILDIDLISFRERGKESRYLSISSVGSDASGSQSESRIYINNREDFDKLKAFISNLNWND